MGMIVSTFSQAFSIYRKDKFIIMLSMIPIVIGAILFYLLGAWMYGDLLASGKSFLSGYISSDGLLSFVSSLLIGIITVLIFVIINFAFVLIVSIISAPFNDLISTRVEKIVKNEVPLSVKESFNQLLKKVFKVIYLKLGHFLLEIQPLS